MPGFVSAALVPALVAGAVSGIAIGVSGTVSSADAQSRPNVAADVKITKKISIAAVRRSNTAKKKNDQQDSRLSSIEARLAGSVQGSPGTPGAPGAPGQKGDKGDDGDVQTIDEIVPLVASVDTTDGSFFESDFDERACTPGLELTGVTSREEVAEGDPDDVTFEEGPGATPDSYQVRVTAGAVDTVATIEAWIFCGDTAVS